MLKKFAASTVAVVVISAMYSLAQAEDGASPTAESETAANKQAAEHPLDAEIRDAKTRLAALKKRVQDYSCRFIKRERVNGELRKHEIIDMKVRHEPFSVYMKFLKPDNLAGQIVVYIEGQNDGNLVALPPGVKGVLGPLSLRPDGPLAMNGQRYPITHVGFAKLTEQLISVAEKDRHYGECKVAHYKGAKVGDRVCSVTEVIHPVPRKNFRYYRARIFVDDELDLPIRFVSWTWPKEEGGDPVLEEEYTYTNVKLNPGFTDADFKIKVK